VTLGSVPLLVEGGYGKTFSWLVLFLWADRYKLSERVGVDEMRVAQKFRGNHEKNKARILTERDMNCTAEEGIFVEDATQVGERPYTYKPFPPIFKIMAHQSRLIQIPELAALAGDLRHKQLRAAKRETGRKLAIYCCSFPTRNKRFGYWLMQCFCRCTRTDFLKPQRSMTASSIRQIRT